MSSDKSRSESYDITAYNNRTNARFKIFRYRGRPETGIKIAQREAREFNMSWITDYRAEPVAAPSSARSSGKAGG